MIIAFLIITIQKYLLHFRIDKPIFLSTDIIINFTIPLFCPTLNGNDTAFHWPLLLGITHRKVYDD